MKILVISPNNADAPAFYRSAAPFAELSRNCNDIQTTDGSNMEITWSVLKNYDIVFLSRPCRQDDLRIATLAKEGGIPLWVDYDDDVFNVNEDNPASLFFYIEQIREVIVETLNLADVLTVSTEALKEVYNRFNSNIKVIPNAWDDRAMKLKDRPKEQKSLILYRGSNTHWVDLYEQTDELIDRITDTVGWDWLFLGYHPWWLAYELKYYHKKEMVPYPPKKITGVYWKGYIDIMYYFNLIKTLAPKLIIVPLSNTPFNKSKSNISWVEGSYAGAATLAPDYLPEFNRPGVIRYKDQEDFGVKLKQSIHKKINLKECADGSWQYIQENLSLTKVNESRKEVAEELVY